MRFAGRVCGRARFFCERGDLEGASRCLLQHLTRLLGVAGIQLNQQVHHDPILIVLVEAHMGEELSGARVAERAVGEAVGGLGKLQPGPCKGPDEEAVSVH